MATLDSIVRLDQLYRVHLNEVKRLYGSESDSFKKVSFEMSKIDSINKYKVTGIIDKYGWFGKEEVGEEGNVAIFLVLLHSDLTTQKKYLAILTEAIKNKKAEPYMAAMLIDKIAIGDGGLQLYGSQLKFDSTKNSFYVLPLEDPDNVDIRRARSGMESMNEYLHRYNLTWDVELYKKELPNLINKRGN